MLTWLIWWTPSNASTFCAFLLNWASTQIIKWITNAILIRNLEEKEGGIQVRHSDLVKTWSVHTHFLSKNFKTILLWRLHVWVKIIIFQHLLLSFVEYELWCRSHWNQINQQVDQQKLPNHAFNKVDSPWIISSSKYNLFKIVKQYFLKDIIYDWSYHLPARLDLYWASPLRQWLQMIIYLHAFVRS